MKKNISKALRLLFFALTLSMYSQTWATTTNNLVPPLLNSSTTDATFLDAKGNKVKLSDLKGKVVFVNFWATWCPPCIKEMPSIQTLYNNFKNKEVVFLMVDVDAKYEKSKAFMDRNKYTLPVLIPGGPISEKYLGNAVPTTLVFDKKGNLAQRIVGGVDYASPAFEKFMNEVLKL